MTSVTMAPNGNIQITTQLLPDAYAALKAAAERDRMSLTNVVNVALMSHNEISTKMDAAGKNLGGAADGEAS